jgi:hypothetical protein
MQATVKLAEQILSVLENENSHDAIKALKIALIMIPTQAIPSRLTSQYCEAAEV